MSVHSKRDGKRSPKLEYDEDEEFLYENSQANSSKLDESPGTSPKDGKPPMEQEKRLRREIANSNERRRMQSINSGFESLKTLIPHSDGEKLSKAAILHQTSDYITALESEKTRLLSQNARLKREMLELGQTTARDTESDLSSSQGSPPPKRKKRDTESSDEGIGMSSGDLDEPTLEEVKREMIYLRCQLDRERRLRIMLEEQTRTLETQLYPERLRQIASQVQAQMRYQEEKQKYLEEQRRIQEEQEGSLAARQAASTASTATPTPQLSATTPATTATSTSPPRSPTTAGPVSPSTPAPAATTLVKRSTPTPVVNTAASSMSRRNLETIVEAIRHLEGDNMLFDCTSHSKGGSLGSSSGSKSGENDSLYASSSGGVASSGSSDEDEELRSSQGSRCSSATRMETESHPVAHKDSDVATLLALRVRTDVAARGASEPIPIPIPRHHHHQHHHLHHHSLHSTTLLNSDRYPVASQLLQEQQQQLARSSSGSFAPQRPAVIVPNLS